MHPRDIHLNSVLLVPHSEDARGSRSSRSSNKRQRLAEIVFLTQALAFFLLSARTSSSFLINESMELFGILSCELLLSTRLAVDIISMRNPVASAVTNTFPCKDLASTRSRSQYKVRSTFGRLIRLCRIHPETHFRFQTWKRT